MSKYLRAELYKVTHRTTYAGGFLGLMFALEAAMLLLLKFASGSAENTFGDVVFVLPMTLSLGLYMAVVVCDMVFSDQYKHNTLKNEVSYGLPRVRIYLGKLAAAILTAVVSCALIFIFYLALGRLLFPVDSANDMATLGKIFAMLGRSLAAAFPAWLGALGLFQMLLFVMKGATSATVAFVLILTLDQALYIMRIFLPKLDAVLLTIKGCLLNVPFDTISAGRPDIPLAWCIGLGWFLVSTAVGLLVFQKREIN